MTESIEMWTPIYMFIDHVVKERRKVASISIHLAANTQFPPPAFTRFCSSRSFKLHNYVELNDPNNYFRSECLAINCDAAVFVINRDSHKHNEDLSVAAKNFDYWQTPYKYFDLDEYLQKGDDSSSKNNES